MPNHQEKFEINLEIESGFDSYYEKEFGSIESVQTAKIALSCPHCQVYSTLRIEQEVRRFSHGEDISLYFQLLKLEDGSTAVGCPELLKFDFICSCPSCENTIFIEAKTHVLFKSWRQLFEFKGIYSGEFLLNVYPQDLRKSKLPDEVPENYAKSFYEASSISDLSPNASAALSRRILQNILRHEFGIHRRTLADEIDAFMSESGVPSYISDAVDAIRNIGNFAAHPLKNSNTGEILDVEPGEAEWLIEVLNTLFDFTFVQPKRLEERRQQLNQKLESLGKPPMKASSCEMEIGENGTDTHTHTDPRNVSGTARDKTSK